MQVTRKGYDVTRSRAFLFFPCALAAICFVFASCALSPSGSVDLLPGVMTFTGDYVASGTNLLVTLPVENQGSAAAPAFTIHFYLAQTSAFTPSTDTDLGTVSAASGVSGNSTATINATLPIPTGINEVCYVYAVVDSTGVVTESNKTNNQSTTATAAAVLVYDLSNGSRTYAIVLQTYLGSDPSLIAGLGATDTIMALYLDNYLTATYLAPADTSGSTDFSLIDKSGSPLGPGTYYVVVESYSGLNGPYALSVRTSNITSSDFPRFVDMTSNSQDTWETDDTPKVAPITQSTTIPVKPDPVKVGSALNRYSADGDWDWFKFVLP